MSQWLRILYQLINFLMILQRLTMFIMQKPCHSYDGNISVVSCKFLVLSFKYG